MGSDPPDLRLSVANIALVDRDRSTGIESIAHDFYAAGQHEMLHELNRQQHRRARTGMKKVRISVTVECWG